MLTKVLGWAIVIACFIAIVWWLVDPVGFANNPLFTYLKLRSSGYHR